MATTKGNAKQNVTVWLDRNTVQSAKLIVARRSTSLSALLACKMGRLVGEEETCAGVKRRAMALLNQGFHVGGKIPARRDDQREGLCPCRVKCRTRNRCPPPTCTPHS
jgi:hypothetical protein